MGGMFMGENIFAKFNEMFNTEELAKAVEEANLNNKPFVKKDVPFGDYEVKIVKLEIGKHDFDDEYKDMPEGKVCFRIINHEELSGQNLYMNKKLISLDPNPKEAQRKSAFLLHKFNEFLTSLGSSVTVSFENWNQYGEMVDSIFKELDGNAEYQLRFFENKGYKDYAIVQRF